MWSNLANGEYWSSIRWFHRFPMTFHIFAVKIKPVQVGSNVQVHRIMIPLLWGRQTSTLWIAREIVVGIQNFFQVQLHKDFDANLHMDMKWYFLSEELHHFFAQVRSSGTMAILIILISGSRFTTKSLPGSPKNISNACHLLVATCHQPPLGFLTGISPDPMA